MTDKEVMKQALEAMIQFEAYVLHRKEFSKEIAALRAQLEQPEQEPVLQERTDYAVHLNHCNIGECEGVCKYMDDDCPALKHADTKAKLDRPTPPSAQPAQRKPLTEKEINVLWFKSKSNISWQDFETITYEIEAAHDIKEEP